MNAILPFLTLDWLRWLLTIELLGIAALPLAAFLFRSFPDRGYGLTKPLGILLIAFLNWWLGSVVGAANVPALLWLLCAGLAAAGIALYRSGSVTLPLQLRSYRRVIALEEGIFLAAFVGWSFVRALKPEIFSSEKPMDFMLLQTSGMTHAFPPPDFWYQGFTVNYYYLGYAIFGMLGRMAVVDPRIGFNLSNITIFALGCTGGFSLAFALTKKLRWGLAGSFFLMLAGDLDTIAQVIGQLRHGGLNESGLDLWCSTRIIDGGCVGQHTITEFPIFSLLFADLHPHVMAIPFVLLVLAIGIHGLLDPDTAAERRPGRYGRLALAAIAVGSLFAINSWDYPTYLLFMVAALLLSAYRAWRWPTEARVTKPAEGDDPDGEQTILNPALTRYLEILGIVPLSLLFYLPYLLTVHSTTGISLRYTRTNLGEMLTVMGGLLIPVGIFILWRGAATFVNPAHAPSSEVVETEEAEPSTRTMGSRRPLGRAVARASARKRTAREEPGALLLAAIKILSSWAGLGCLALLFFVVVLPWRTDLVFAALLAVAAYAMVRHRDNDEPATQATLLLALTGILPLLLADFGFIRDIFSGGANYRLNTVFKLYYQGWILLAVAAPYATYTLGHALRRLRSRLPARIWYAAFAALVIGTGLYTVEGIGSQGASLTAARRLDGLAFVRDTEPDVYAAVRWAKAHTQPDDVVAEGEGLSYWHGGAAVDTNQFSVFAGRPTIVGWPNDHEWLWRGAFTKDASGRAAAAAVLGRMSDVDTLYRTTDVGVTVALLRRYHVRYVYIGPFERATYYADNGGAGLGKFSRLLTPVFDRGAVTVFKVPASLSRFKAASLPPLPASSAPVLPMMTATNLHVDPNGQAMGLKAGEVYMIVHLSVRNDAAAPINFALDELRLHSPATNQEYPVAFDPNILQTQLLPETIYPGGELDGDLAFEMPVADSHSANYSVVFRPAK